MLTMAMTLLTWFQRVSRQRFLRYGMPFLVCIVGGSFALKHFTSVRYDFRRTTRITNEEAKKFGVTLKNKETVEDVYEDLQKVDLDSWQNIRGPRPWEDSKTVQNLQKINSE
ncbi:cytochrome c oxidase assembly protein COX16 homolog, mitochondrial-like [Pomacea canaliculata]|uniref:cytochrome c oxidase assembly protein COX16 homolog, mitochondrial-like n=1 Tax=Pomacea canaliculata TaxID=400727 RepID=UPI000D738C20|nr:cytochrome c oxidase assembly protein COX16 homolog, mitochondrial-like [Pomacea canaliculata]